ERAARETLRAQVGLEFVAPLEDQPPRPVAFDHLTRIADTAIRDHELPGRAWLPGRLVPRLAPVEPRELGLDQCLPELFRRGPDVGHIHELTCWHGITAPFSVVEGRESRAAGQFRGAT